MDEALCDGDEAAGLERLAGLAAQEAALHAARAEQLHESARLSRRACGPDGPERFLVIDLAGTLRIGQLAANHLLAEAQRLVEVLTGTLAGLRTGRVFVPQARIVLEETRSCSEEVAAEVDRRLHAGTPEGLADWLARRLRDRVRRLVLQVEAELEPEVTQERERAAREARRVSVRPEADGMASLWALLPAEQLRAFTLGLDELHRRQLLADRSSGIERTADQRRADLLAVLPALALHALDGTSPAVGADGSCAHSAVVVEVHVPLATALGLSGAPGTLDGHGPISAHQARALLTAATLRRVVVDDRTGQPLRTRTTPVVRPGRTAPAASTAPARPVPSGGAAAEQLARPAVPPATGDLDVARSIVPRATGDPDVDPRLQRLLEADPVQPGDLLDPVEPQYAPSAALARFVRRRDPLCTAPGCSTHSRRSDLDHEEPWPHGPTSAGNLTPRSRRCHRAKTLSWSVRRAPDGAHRWTSPTGRSYRVPPAWDPPPPVISAPVVPAPLVPVPCQRPSGRLLGAARDHVDTDTGLSVALSPQPLRPPAVLSSAARTAAAEVEPPF